MEKEGTEKPNLLFGYLPHIHINTLIYSNVDSRSGIVGRDDNANMSRMYYQLYKNTFLKNWKKGKWLLKPDQFNLDWDDLKLYLNTGKSCSIEHDIDLFNRQKRKEKLFEVIDIEKGIESHKEVLVQVADMFAGMAIYSYNNYERICEYIEYLEDLETPSLFGSKEVIKFDSNSEKIRIPFVVNFQKRCKKHSLGVSLKNSRTAGLHTYRNRNYNFPPINFWLYSPQGDYDKAPKKIT